MLTDLLDDHAAFNTGVLGNLAERFLDSARHDVDTGGLVLVAGPVDAAFRHGDAKGEGLVLQFHAVDPPSVFFLKRGLETVAKVLFLHMIRIIGYYQMSLDLRS